MAVSSEYFRAAVGVLDEATAARFERWAGEHCVRHLLVRENDGCRTLFAQRDGARSVKSTKVCLRTVFSNFGRPLANLDPTWLVLLTREEFEDATSAPTNAVTQQQLPEPQPEVVADPVAATVLLSLSPGFDKRAEEAFAALRRTVLCAA